MTTNLSTVTMRSSMWFNQFIHKILSFQHSYTQNNTQTHMFYPQIIHSLWTKRTFPIEQFTARPNVV